MPNGHCQSWKNKSRSFACFLGCLFSLPVAILGSLLVMLCCGTLCLFFLCHVTLFHSGWLIKGPQVYIPGSTILSTVSHPAPGSRHDPDSYCSQLPCSPAFSPCLQNVKRKARYAAKKAIAHLVIDSLDNQETKTIHTDTEKTRRA